MNKTSAVARPFWHAQDCLAREENPQLADGPAFGHVAGLFFVYTATVRVVCILGAVVLSLFITTAATAQEQVTRKATSGFAKLSAQANAARDANQLEYAVSLYKRALAMRPGWVEGWFSLGTIEYDQDDYADAAHAFDKVRALDPKAGTARVMLGLCEFELGHDADALKHIEEGKNIGIANDQQLRRVMIYHEGVLFQRAGKFESAQTELKRICADRVGDDGVTQVLGMAVLRISSKSTFVQGSPGAAVVSAVGHAECLAARRKSDDARQAYTDIIRDFPDYPNIHFAYGRFLLGIDETSKGIAELQKEIANDPNHVFARLEIAAAMYRTDSAGGLPYAEQAVKLNPEFPLGHYLLGLLLLDLGNFQRAIAELETARKGYPNEAQVYYALGNAYARAGRNQDAAQARAMFLRLRQRKQEESEVSSFGPKAAAENEKLSKRTDPNAPQE